MLKPLTDLLHHSILRLVLLFLLLLISCGRFGLLLHEFVGHALPAELLGADVNNYYLTWFSGGWVSYQNGHHLSQWMRYLISLGGVLIELLVALPLLCIPIKNTQLKFTLRLLGSSLAIHGLWYLTHSYYYIYGDGAILKFLIQPDQRIFFIIFTTSLTCFITFFLCYRYAYLFQGLTQEQHRGWHLLVLVACAMLALSLYSLLMKGERWIMHEENDSFKALMTPEHEKRIALEKDALLKLLEALKEKGVELPKEEQSKKLKAIEDKHQPFNFDLCLRILMTLSLLLGYSFSKPKSSSFIELNHLPLKFQAGFAAITLVLCQILISLGPHH